MASTFHTPPSTTSTALLLEHQLSPSAIAGIVISVMALLSLFLTGFCICHLIGRRDRRPHPQGLVDESLKSCFDSIDRDSDPPRPPPKPQLEHNGAQRDLEKSRSAVIPIPMKKPHIFRPLSTYVSSRIRLTTYIDWGVPLPLSTVAELDGQHWKRELPATPIEKELHTKRAKQDRPLLASSSSSLSSLSSQESDYEKPPMPDRKSNGPPKIDIHIDLTKFGSFTLTR